MDDSVQHDTMQKAVDVIQEALRLAQQDGKFMVAVWSVDETTLHLRTRTTWKFPTGDEPAALEQLQQGLQVKTAGPPAAQPLQAAAYKPWMQRIVAQGAEGS